MESLVACVLKPSLKISPLDPGVDVGMSGPESGRPGMLEALAPL